MKNPTYIKIATLLLALSFVEPRVAYADAKEDAAQAAKDVDKAYDKAQENIPDKNIKEKEDQLDKAAQDNDETQGDPAKDPTGKNDPAKDPAKEKAQKKEDEARNKADKADPDKTGAPYRKALEDRREACKRLKKALDELRKQLQKRRGTILDPSDLEKAIRDAEAARKRQKKVPQPPTLSMVAPQGAPTLATFVASGKIKVDSAGTGETIGHVADLKIQNLTDQPIKCAVGPMILESASGRNQHYACPTGQAVALNAHQTKTVPMNGVCLNRNKPPVGKGVSADLVINEANPSGPQNPNSHIPANQAGDLLRICTAKYDAAATLQKDGALKNLPYKDKQKQKDIVVQWSTWCDPRISEIIGAPPATKDDLKKVVYKQIKGPMSPETKKKVDQGIDTIFEKVELTTAKAKDLEKPPSSQAELTGEEAKSVSSTTTALPAVAVAQQERKPCCVILKIEFKVAGTKGKGEEVKDFLDKLTEELKKAGGEGAEQIGETGSKIIKGYEVIAGLTQPWEIYVTLGKGVCKGEKCEVKDKVECRLIPRTKSGQKDGIGGGEAGSERENWLPPTAKDWWKDVGIEELARALANILKYCECDDGSYTWPSPDAKPVSGCK